jgi:hypothetical protein
MEDRVFVNGVDYREGAIVFRYLEKYRPGSRMPPPSTWQVEFHGDHDRGFPSGLAWVSAPPGHSDEDFGISAIVFVLVADDCRRKGVASKLIRACLDRWPKIQSSGGISEGGKALCKRFWKPRPIEEILTPEALPAARAEGFSDEEIRRALAGAS